MFFKIRNLPSNLSIIEQLFAVLAGSIISKFIKPQCIFSGVENIGIAENSGDGFSWIYTKIMQNSRRPTKPQIRGIGIDILKKSPKTY